MNQKEVLPGAGTRSDLDQSLLSKPQVPTSHSNLGPGSSSNQGRRSESSRVEEQVFGPVVWWAQAGPQGAWRFSSDTDQHESESGKHYWLGERGSDKQREREGQASMSVADRQQVPRERESARET